MRRKLRVNISKHGNTTTFEPSNADLFHAVCGVDDCAYSLQVACDAAASDKSGIAASAEVQSYLTLVGECCAMGEKHGLPARIEHACKIALRSFTSGRSFKSELVKMGYREGK